MSKKSKMTKIGRSSLDLADSEAKTKKDVLTKARNKLIVLGDALKNRKPDENQNNRPLTKSMTQSTLDYLFKSAQNKEKDNSYQSATSRALQKQLSLTSYPVAIKISSFDDDNLPLKPISRLRPATIGGGDSSNSTTDALALERPKKKLSFKDPEVIEVNDDKAIEAVKSRLGFGYSAVPTNSDSDKINGHNSNLVVGNGVHRVPSYEDTNLDSQAMRVVRTIGQAFEVCHKLSITAPENEDILDPDEQDTLTQDLLSDRISDAASDKPKKDIISEGASDKMSLPPDDCISIKDFYPYDNGPKHRPVQLDILAPPPSSKKSQLSAETYAAPHSDVLSSGVGGNSTVSNTSGALSAHHELQLLREQLDQQNQQTQSAIAQLQLAREQLAAEKAARLEAQARTHQLLIHNRELLDHIAALVAHLQGGEKSGQQPPPPHMAMPQLNQQTSIDSNYSQNQDMAPQIDTNLILQALGLNTPGPFENRPIATNLPASPLRNSYPGGGIFNFAPYSPPATESNFDGYQINQILQRLQNLSGNPTSPPFNMGQSMPYLYNPNPMFNNYYGFQSPAQPQYQTNAYATLPRNLSNLENRVQSSRHSEPRTLPSDRYSGNSNSSYQSPPIGLDKYQKPNFPSFSQPEESASLGLRRNVSQNNFSQDTYSKIRNAGLQRSNSSLQVSQDSPRLQRGNSPRPETQTDSRTDHLLKPQGQMGTMTTTDSAGRVRVIVPVPYNSIDEADDTLSNLRINDELRLMNGPGISRSCSERVPNRSELMSQVQRTWARHTTK